MCVFMSEVNMPRRRTYFFRHLFKRRLYSFQRFLVPVDSWKPFPKTWKCPSIVMRMAWIWCNGMVHGIWNVLFSLRKYCVRLICISSVQKMVFGYCVEVFRFQGGNDLCGLERLRLRPVVADAILDGRSWLNGLRANVLVWFLSRTESHGGVIFF